MKEQTTKSRVYFKGLNSLRFYAAFFVVLMHIQSNMDRVGLPSLPEFPFLLKGFSAVAFFFTLSGFLITYLLLQEKENTNTIDVPHFYMRRVYRIWPLYFLIIIFGLLFYKLLVPALGMEFPHHYKVSTATLLYTFFLANLMNSLYHVGGMLHITWSIAVEEQFYLFWAPLAKKFMRFLPQIIISIILVSTTVNVLNSYNFFNLSEGMQQFIHTLQFHYMAIGAFFAWRLYHYREQMLSSIFFKSKLMQWLCFSAILAFYFLYKKQTIAENLLILPMGCLYAWLIICISSNPLNSIRIYPKATEWLGNISYGIYMYHMIFVYGASFLFLKLQLQLINEPLYFVAYYLFVLGATFSVSYLSFVILEKPLIKRGKSWRKLKSNVPKVGINS